MIPQIKQIVGPRLLSVSTFEADVKMATDLIIMQAKDLKIAARVRRPGYAEKYPFQFTIRSERDSGTETELSKILKGFGDIMFYGHADDSNIIYKWFLLDLDAFRVHYNRGRIKFAKRSNHDGTHFHAFDAFSFRGHPLFILGADFWS